MGGKNLQKKKFWGKKILKKKFKNSKKKLQKKKFKKKKNSPGSDTGKKNLKKIRTPPSSYYRTAGGKDDFTCYLFHSDGMKKTKK